MVYFAPYIDESGLHIPTYQDIENYLVEQARTIFGQDIYLENDSQDFQFIAAVSKLCYDTLLTSMLAYNARSPRTAVGTGLAAVVALNGIKPKSQTNSIVTVTCVGTPYTVINSGIISDANGNKWNLPETVTIGENGTVSVTATCQTAGAITAFAGEVNRIQTPTFGWTSVSNPAAATPGQPVEQDSDLRERQAISVAVPSQALTEGILGSVLAVENVLDAQLYENDTGAPLNTINGAYNPGGFPEHSITLVVNGGADDDIARAIYLRKTPGCYTDGDIETEIVDQYNVTTTIRFYRPEEVMIDVEITIDPLANYTSDIGDDIIDAVTAYIDDLNIGQSLIISELWQAALSTDNNRYPLFSLKSITAGADGDPLATDDISLNFNQKAMAYTVNLTLV